MIAATHRALTAAVEDELGLPHEASQYATLPDDVADVVCGVLGPSVLGHSAAGLCHFCAPTADGKFRGYSWRMDGSVLSWLRKLDVPLGDVACDPRRWADLLGRDAVTRHPLRQLLDSLRGKAPVEVDSLTFPTAAAMAAWLWSLARTPAVVGSVCHLVQDVCVPHHASGWLLAGHAEYELHLHTRFLRLPRPLIHGAVAQTGEARDEVERCAAETAATCGQAMDAVLARAALATARVLTWARRGG